MTILKIQMDEMKKVDIAVNLFFMNRMFITSFS